MMRFLILPFYFFITLSLQLSAAPRCETSLFGPRPEKIMQAITTQLKRYNYEMEGQNLFKNEAGAKQFIGTVEMIQPRFLFEWQEEDYHDEWIAHKGLSKGDMDFTLANKGQSYGRGFYVSLSPTDSMMYGTHLTIFETSAPLFILKSFNSQYNENEVVLNELRKMGFSGIRCTPTWLNIFNENYLNDAKRINKKILDQIYEPGNGVVEFTGWRLLQQPSIAKILGSTYTIPKMFKKINASTTLSLSEENFLRSEFANNTINFIRQIKLEKNEFAILRKVLGTLSIEDIRGIAGRGDQFEIQDYISKAFNDIPSAGAFFTLFDLFGVATIGEKRMTDPFKFSEMKSDALKYQKALASTDLRAIKSVSDFSRFLQNTFGTEYVVRDSEIFYASMQKGVDHGTFASSFLYDLSKNSFLTVHKLDGFVLPTGQQRSVLDISYFGLDSLPKVKSLFSTVEYQKIQGLLGDQGTAAKQKKGITYATTLLLNKFFDPTQFAAIAQVMGESVSPMTLYKAFVSLQPYEVGNRRSSDLYYRWLVANHFPKSSPILRSLMKEADLVQTDDQLSQAGALNWNLTRLWVLSADSEKEMIQRAREVLLKDPRHFNFTQMIEDVSALIQ